MILDVAEMLDNAVVVSVTVMTVVTVIIDIQGLEVHPTMLDLGSNLVFFCHCTIATRDSHFI